MKKKRSRLRQREREGERNANYYFLFIKRECKSNVMITFEAHLLIHFLEFIQLHVV